MQFVINHIYIFMTVIFAVCSQLVIKWKMSTFSFSSHETIIDKFYFAVSMLINPYIILSLVFTLFSGLSWMIAMTKFDISYAYPYVSLGFLLIFIFSVLLFNEPFSWNKFVGALIIVLGIIVSSKSS